MDKYQEKIEDVIEQALTEKTFSLEIIGKIKSLKEDFEDATDTIERQCVQIKDLKTENSELTGKLSKSDYKLREFIAREADIIAKEKDLEKNRYELDFQKNRASEIKDLFCIVFKNPVMKESVFKNESVPVVINGYTQTSNASSSSNSTKEIE